MNRFRLSTDVDTARDVAAVLARVDTRVIRSIQALPLAATFRDIFNCFSTFQFMLQKESYILETGGDLERVVSTWDNENMAQFFQSVLNGEVNGISVSKREQASLIDLIDTLKKVTDESQQHKQ